jgi:hypothetical protein
VPKTLTNASGKIQVGCIGPSAIQSGPRVPSNFHLFLHLKKHPTWKKFNDDEVLKEVVMTRFKGQAADFCDSGIQKSVPILNKCLGNAGDYVEK